MNVRRFRKLVASICAGLATIVAAGLAHGTALVAVTVVLAMAGSYGVYKAPNAPS